MLGEYDYKYNYFYRGIKEFIVGEEGVRRVLWLCG